MDKFEGVTYTYKSKDGESQGVSITKFPDRKMISLCTVRGNSLTPIAYFVDQEAAQEMITILSILTRGVLT